VHPVLVAQALILIIEDNPDIAALLRHDLLSQHYRVVVATSVMQGLTLAREQRPDLVLLDLGLPDGDGRDVLRRLRQRGNLPIIVLTARDAVEEKVELLGLGADDYVVKPYQEDELLARIAVQLRQEVASVLSLGDLSVFPHKRLALCGERELRLSPKEFDLLAVLMRQPGRVYSRAELAQTVWPEGLNDASNVLDVHMATLRGKLRDVDLAHLLRTVRGVGYALQD
jgi:two-component system, OmpR family, copper resistance phosphate regulon response regulator CusR